LAKRARRWFFYERVMNLEFDKVTPEENSYLSTFSNRSKLANMLSDEINIPKEDVAVLLGEFKGYRKIDLKFFDHEDVEQKYDNLNSRKWLVHVYTHPKWRNKKEEIRRIVSADSRLPKTL